MISSEMPSLKNSFSGSALMLANGSTAIDLSDCAPESYSALATRMSRTSSSAN